MHRFLWSALLISAAVLAQGNDGKDVKYKTFVAVYGHGPNWVNGKGSGGQPGIRDHADYMILLHMANKLKHGGPFMDGSGGMTVFLARDVDAAKAVVANDPAIKSGVMKLTMLRPWMSIDWAAFAKQVAPKVDKRRVARTKCKEYYDSAKTWRMINKKYPQSLKAMEAPLSPAADEDFIRVEHDPWGNDYVLLVDGKNIQVASWGPDGQEGTDDDVLYPSDD